MDYKDSLLLPKTDFAMRGNLPQNEPKRYKEWFESKNVYKRMIENRKNATKSFTLHDGPPYANGYIHIGHALNKILKDIIVKTHYFFGEKVRYTPGWDCHGLPIEQQVEVKVTKEKKDLMPKSKFRELCREHAKKFIDIQMNEFKALGVVGDWENPYLTMKFEFEAEIYRNLCQLAKKGYLIERSKPVFWSWAAKSALAEAEVEYKDKEDYSIFVAFELEKEALEKLEVKSASAVIWTTTPWTLPSNEGIALNEEEKYILNKDGFIIAKKLYQSLIEQGVINAGIAKEFDAKILENSYAINPLNGKKSKFILGEHVTMDGGSGLVHTAPGHGEDDYYVGLKYGLNVTMPVDDDGKFDERVKSLGLFYKPDEFIGVHVFSSNERILELLGKSLLKQSKFTHSYPFCWRTHKPVIYRATKQWFVAMDDVVVDGMSLRQRASKELKSVKFYPQSGAKRLGSMIENRPDWCISRQRDWGVPIAFFRDKTTKKPIFEPEILEYIAEIFEEKGADAWWDLEIKDLLKPNSSYNASDLEKTEDILDVWFDSGSTWKAVLKSDKYDAGDYRANMYLEGSDQHRGWFQSSLLVSTACENKAPYKSILTHGFTVDENGNKMSKSKGNVVAPNDIAKEYGVEILRLWVAYSDYTSDLKISKNIITQMSEQYRKIRNTIRFLFASCEDLDEICVENLGDLDKWILSLAKKTFDEVSASFQEYDFSKGYQKLSFFITTELSGIYLDINKDRLYCQGENDKNRRATQSAIALITKSLLALIAPVLTYTIDEAMEFAPRLVKGNCKDAFDLVYESLPSVESNLDTEFIITAREKFFEIIDNLKKEKLIKSTLELNLETNSNVFLGLEKQESSDWFLVSDVSKLSQSESLGEFEAQGSKFKITRSQSAKCPRCWKFQSKDEQSLCQRCQKVMQKVVNV